MVLVFHVVYQYRLIKRVILRVGLLIISQHLDKFSGNNKHCVSRNMFLVVEEQDSTCSLNFSIILHLKHMTWKHVASFDQSDLGRRCSE